MITVGVVNTKGSEKENIVLNEEIFAKAGKRTILYEAVKMQLANMRQGNACTKNRAEVNKTGKKPWKQKGTGRARAGSAGSPVWKGGGIVFGPKPRDFGYNVPKKLGKLAVKLALSEKVKANEFIVLDDIDIDLPKTKNFNEILKNLKIENNKVLIVLADKNENIEKSARNIPNVKVLTVKSLNVYDVLNNDKILITKDAVNKIQEVLS
ncbi:50S ribosomal protein L4 [Candidatus Desantisbacteria bacterium]|nr:50S ribosomal protein L4 [Candidatus Desantisbacteria bacterium]